jgi:hypothetical protein
MVSPASLVARMVCQYVSGCGCVLCADAITGTARDYVVEWYTQQSLDAILDLQSVQAASVSALAGAPSDTQFSLVNSTSGVLPLVGAGQSITVVVFNPLGTLRSEPVCRQSWFSDITVKDTLAGLLVPSQTFPNMAHYFNASAPPFELCFSGLIPPLGFTSFVITRGSSASFTPAVPATTPGGFVVLQNPYMSVQFDSSTGALAQIQRLSYPPINMMVNQSFAAYEDLGNAYEFFPTANVPTPLALNGTAYFVQGPIVSIAFQIFEGQLVHAMRLYNCSDCSFLESAFVLGPLSLNTAVVSVFETDLDTQGVLYSGVRACLC